MTQIPYSEIQNNTGRKFLLEGHNGETAIIHFSSIKNNILYGTSVKKNGSVINYEGSAIITPKEVKAVYILD